MAKFSQQFLRALAQPSYQKGLFTAAQSFGEMPGKIKEEERRLAEIAEFKQMNPDQQLDFLESKAETLEDVIKIQDMRAEAELAKARAKKAEADARWASYTRSKEIKQDNDNKLVDATSLLAVDSGDINGYISTLSPEIPDSIKERIRQEAVAIQESREAAGLIATEGVLPPEYIEALQSNPKLADNPNTKEQLRLYKNPKNPGDKKRAALNLRALVDEENKRIRNLQNSEAYAVDRAGDALRYLQNMESEVYRWESEDLARVVQGLEGDDLEDFTRKLELEYRKNISATPEDAARKALDQMIIETPGEGLAERRRDERKKLAEKREAALQELMGKGMTKAEAETELDKQSRERLKEKRRKTTANIRAVRQAAKERKYGKSPRG